MQQAYVIEAEQEEGIDRAKALVEEELGMKGRANPDVIVLRYGLLTVEDARKVAELASSGAHSGEHKVVIIAASRAYHEAQNALLKIFEEPPRGAYLFLVLPNLGSLLPTLRSRVQILPNVGFTKPYIPEMAQQFLRMSKEKRSAFIKKLATGRDEEERREHREEAIAIVNGLEQAAYVKWKADGNPDGNVGALLSDIAALRGYLYDRSAPVRMILEHISLVLPKSLQ